MLQKKAVRCYLQIESVEHNNGNEEKVTKENFALAKALDHKKLKVAYAG